MSGHKKHTIVGIIAAIIFGSPAYSLAGFNVLAFAVLLIGSYYGANYPDKREPCEQSTHRRFFHSRVMAGLCIAAFMGIMIISLSLNIQYRLNSPKSDIFESVKLLAFSSILSAAAGFIIAYISHLALDARTPMGLPFLTGERNWKRVEAVKRRKWFAQNRYRWK